MQLYGQPTQSEERAEELRKLRKYAWAFGVIITLIALLPALLGALASDSKSTYLGYQFNTDDQMVYASWMRQASQGQFLFDNRFTTDPQPGQTIHLYFWVLGLASKFLGLAGAETCARAIFSFLFVQLLAGLIARLNLNVFESKLSLTLSVLGGGAGFVTWQAFGNEATSTAGRLLSPLINGMQPTDAWQTESFVFPSMLTTSLFMASLCLVTWIFCCVLDSKTNGKAILPGFIALLLLTNIHSYDVLTIALVLLLVVAISWRRKELTKAWVLRVGLMATGVIPPGLWFAHVLKSDAVFQARAATPTYMANFRPFLAGLIFLVALGAVGVVQRAEINSRLKSSAILALPIIAFYLFAGPNTESYWLSMPIWLMAYVVMGTCAVMLSTESVGLNLVLGWALAGLIIPYFPELFQRKLAAGIAIPWGILATLGIAQIIRRMERNARNMVAVCLIVLVSFTSLLWLNRELQYIKNDVSRTVVQPVFLSRDAQRVIAELEQPAGQRTVVVAMPGVGQKGETDGDFRTPYIADLNPILSAYCGVYTYAGHWSETPHYMDRRSESMAPFMADIPLEKAQAWIAKVRPDYLVGPSKEGYLSESLRDLSVFGDVVYRGNQLILVRVRR